MASEKVSKKDKNQNIQVFVRLRPLNQRERDIKSLGVIEVANNREVIVRHAPSKSTKKFTYDRAFGPNAKQVEVYQAVVSPLIEEVLCGYNCTVFAYGQTGSGKTHTMVGEHSSDDTDWQSDPLAGIIPRALSQLFDELRISNTEYTVRVSYLELYNEELFDLLASSEDNTKLRIYEDVTRKGSNIVNGLEEITVYDKNDVYKIMTQGQERKRVASTLMNAQSSRSHTVFTIVVHMRENSSEGEELVKIGKLNLVDLAGSENISKAGSDNPAKRERARECVNINQSLLTLGRVITALVERHPHIPYRESKLTRILQESLGGRTKTSIIATASPGHKDLEETMSTLEYAYRAKNIQNKPEVNQKMTKKAILLEYAEEIDRLKRDLQAARDKNGVYLANEDFAELTLKQEEQRKEIQELLLKKRAMEEEKEKMENIFSDLQKTLEMRSFQIKSIKNKLNNTRIELIDKTNVLESTKAQVEETEHIVQKQQETETALSQQAEQLLATADIATTHVSCLHDTVDRRKTVESTNLTLTQAYREQSSQCRANISEGTTQFTQAMAQQLKYLNSALDEYLSTETQTLQNSNVMLAKIVEALVDTSNKMRMMSGETQNKIVETVDCHQSEVKSAILERHNSIQKTLTLLKENVMNSLHSAQNQAEARKVVESVKLWYLSAIRRVSSLRSSRGAFVSLTDEIEKKRIETARRHRDKKLAVIQQRAGDLQTYIEDREREKCQIEKYFEAQLEQYDADRRTIMDMLSKLDKARQDTVAERDNYIAQASRQIEMQMAWRREIFEEMSQLAEQFKELEVGQEESLTSVKSYAKEFDEGTSAVSTELETVSTHVVEVLDQLFKELQQTIISTEDQLEKDAVEAIEEHSKTGSKFLQISDTMLNDLVKTNKDVMDHKLTNIEATINSTIESIKSVSSGSSALLSSSELQCSSHGTAVQQMQAQLEQFCQRVVEATVTHRELERRYLSQEYKVYEPTGATPNRMEYRYPRQLAATSPHDRILNRFRRMRQNNFEESCILVESDTESPGSESEGEGEGEHAVFVAPSKRPALHPASRPPSPRPNGQHVGIVKCTSESDILYSIRRKQDEGKENADRSMSHRKPSKLPAPALASFKKPLESRNN